MPSDGVRSLASYMVWILLPQAALRAAIAEVDKVKGEAMPEEVPARINDIAEVILEEQTTIETTLYDLMVAIREEIAPHEEHLVTPIVVYLLNSGRIKFVEGSQHHRIICT